MLIKGFAVLLLFLIPFFIYSSKRHQSVTPKIIYFTPTPRPSVSPTNSPAVNGISSIITQNSPTPAISVLQITITPAQNVQQASFNDFFYPNSQIVSQDQSSAILDSTDSPQAVTDWYKNKITQMGMNTTSIIATSTNDNVSNKITAGNSSKQIQVEINKSSGESQVKILVSLKNQ